MKTRDIAPIGVRMQSEVKEALKKVAKEQGRSLNSEIVQRLKESLKKEGVVIA
ncbi:MULTISPECIES: Arc family DNA-binding protein [Arsenophonus]|uniref:Arc family DNA-binding protein n=2 Tax=Arsenophonus TaxID=637 RepID=A0AA95GJZ8_9GAMM|nr:MULTISPECIES: Arc family DNA-binding protein [Arsenophonus]WGM00357.1 Arc family DNA-binding protein [Arsenophonus nasoniae]WGM01904.1 Arc family DNA-binding protein [Arsenophonus nasoniae]WGO82291.1 Arc family DNA-binding protein [Arsenophonus apicola]